MSNTISSSKVAIDPSWKKVLSKEFEQPYFTDIKNLLVKEKSEGTNIFPAGSLIFNAFNLTPFAKVKVVIIGQDPYHGPGQAHGLSFSVPKGIPAPPSLQNIFKEINSDLGIPVSYHGNLEHWASQGVLLLNAILTVKAHMAASHQRIGWERFTDAVIKSISEHKQGVVFLLWGRFAQQKAELIDKSKHHILMAAHPSPLSAYNGFFGCKHFSKTNEFLVKENLAPIDWQLP